MVENDRQTDEGLLIDFLLGRCDGADQREVQGRLERDDAFRRLHDDIRNTFAALDMAPEYEPPETLVADTMRRIGSARRTDALLAREELSRHDVLRATFSLRELAAIAGVILLVFSIVGVSVREAGRRQDRLQCESQVARLGTGFQAYANSNSSYLPGTGLAQLRWLPAAGRPAVSNSKALFQLVRNGYVEPQVFQCPAIGGGSFAVKAGMIDFPASRFVSYSYQYSIGDKGTWLEDPALGKVRKSLAILADASPLFPNGRFAPERLRRTAGDNHDGAGQNVLYADMHVEFQSRPVVGVDGDHIFLAGNIRTYSGEETPTGPSDTFLLPAFSGDGVTEFEGAGSRPSSHD
ncbi:MAG TPA: hypothetical protein VM695_06495 [Phycisphaerae bacterium]|nr:hypothetical protein [Phycisphaerae bacterium]